MKLCLRILTLLLVVTGTLSQDLDLADALGDFDPTPAKPKEKPKTPGESDDPKPDKPTVKPPKDGGGGGGFGLDLEDALGPDPKPDKPDKPAVKPPKGGGGDGGFNLDDALGPDLKPNKPVKPPPSGGGGGNFDDSDLVDVGNGNYKPDGGRAADSNYDPHGGADQPQEASSGPIAGIISAVGMALVGAASSYFAYQKKKLCFKLQGGRDPESGNGQVRSDPQVYSDLLRTS